MPFAQSLMLLALAAAPLAFGAEPLSQTRPR